MLLSRCQYNLRCNNHRVTDDIFKFHKFNRILVYKFFVGFIEEIYKIYKNNEAGIGFSIGS